MTIEHLQSIQDDFNYTLAERSEIEEKVQEELDLMLEDYSKAEIREELDELDDSEFRELVERILDQN